MVDKLNIESFILENVQDAVIIMAEDGKFSIAYWNKGAEKIYGWCKEEVLGQSAPVLFQTKFEQKSRKKEDVIIQTKEEKCFQGRVSQLRKDGIRIPVESRVIALQDSKGKITGWLASNRDISKQIDAEKSLKVSDAKYRELFYNDTDAVIFIDSLTLGIEDVNPAGLALFGYSRSEILELKLADLTDAYSPLEVTNLINSGQQTRMGNFFIRKDGTSFFCVYQFGSFNALGRSKLCLTIRDITQQKRLEEEIQVAQKLSAVGQLASSVAHEVRNPLNAILAIVELLSVELDGDSEYREYIEHINIQLEKMSKMMSDLLELGKIPPRELVGIESLREICLSLGQYFNQRYSQSKCNIDVIDEYLIEKVFLLANPERLDQVIRNLIENSIQNCPGAAKVIVKILQVKPGWVTIQVVDNGKGISKEIFPHLFEPFYTSRKKGVGLGLTIVKSIIENHKGTIRFYNNDPMPGCTVEICFPLVEKDA